MTSDFKVKHKENNSKIYDKFMYFGNKNIKS